MRTTDVRLSDDVSLFPSKVTGGRLRLLLLGSVLFALWYFGWLLHPERIGSPVLYAGLVAAEGFNLVQAAGFWWTVSREHRRPRRRLDPAVIPAVDVLIPVYDEPLEIVEPTLEAASRIRGRDVRVALLDDGDRSEMRSLAARYGAAYIARSDNFGAKAGNINHALRLTSAPFVAIFDSDHVADPAFLESTMRHFQDGDVALVQTPQYYANASDNRVAGAAWAQQALFFGAIARGKDGLGAMFCCGTNMVLRRAALEDAGGFPQDSVTEDFELSIGLHERGWRSVYVSEVLARGLGPEDMGSYVGQQLRWARGCLSAIPRVLRSDLRLTMKLQYLLSSMFFLSGWTLLIYMTFPVIRIATGAQPLAGASADLFLLHFAPYFSLSLLAVAVAGSGTYTYSAFTLMSANFWVHVQATIAAVLRLPSRFVVTPKAGGGRRQPLVVLPGMAAAAVLIGAAAYGLVTDPTPGTLNNVAFAALHVTVLVSGISPALMRPLQRATVSDESMEEEAA